MSCPPFLWESEQCSLPGESLSLFSEMLLLCYDLLDYARTCICKERAIITLKLQNYFSYDFTASFLLIMVKSVKTCYLETF